MTEGLDKSGVAYLWSKIKSYVPSKEELISLMSIISVSSQSTYATTSIVSNPEFYIVITDSEDKIIIGIRRDFTYVGLEPQEAIGVILDVMYNINN